MGEFRIETERLILREWREADAVAMLPSGQDARVMEFLGPLMDLGACRELVDGQILNQSLFGHCFWPIERKSDEALLGLCGLNPGPENSPLEGKPEIGWRLAYTAWGQGYAREAAQATLDWAWRNMPDDEVFSMTVAVNLRSWRLMERLGMVRRPDLDFDHPELALGNPLRPQICYSIGCPLLTR
jgi:RimJ/RimL family protein N-acetyltransferase